MKVCHPSENFTSLKTLILQLQLTLELSRTQEILSIYTNFLLLFAEYPSLFNFFTNNFISQAPERAGGNWYGYAGQNLVRNIDPTGLVYYDQDGVHSSNDATIPHKSTGQGQTPKVPDASDTTPTNKGWSGDEKSANNKKNNTSKTILRDIYLKLSFKKKSQILIIDSYIGNKKIHSRSIRVTNNVRSPESRGKPVKYRNYYYYPGEFPNGEWNVTGAGFDDSNPDIGPYIKTDAGTWGDTWQKSEEGNWEKTGEQVYDTGYLFHGSDGEQNTRGNNNENYSTWGCGRGNNADIMSVGLQVLFVINGGGTVTVTVGD